MGVGRETAVSVGVGKAGSGVAVSSTNRPDGVVGKAIGKIGVGNSPDGGSHAVKKSTINIAPTQ